MTEYESLPQQGFTEFCKITVQNVDWRQFHFLFNGSEPASRTTYYDVMYDGAALMVRRNSGDIPYPFEYEGTEMFTRDLTVTGRKIPFFVKVNIRPEWHQDVHERGQMGFSVRWNGSAQSVALFSLDGMQTFLTAPDGLRNGSSHVEQLKMDYNIAMPYNFLRQQVLDNGGLLVSARQNHIGLYTPDGEQVNVPPKVIEKMHLFSTEADAAVGFIKKNDVLTRLTRFGIRTGDMAHLGFRQGQAYIGTKRGTLATWARVPHGTARPAQSVMCAAKHSYVRLIPALHEAYLAIPEMPEWAGRMTLLGEVEKMNDNEKKLMRAWWSAYISQQAKLGKEIPSEHQEAAEKFLS